MAASASAPPQTLLFPPEGPTVRRYASTGTGPPIFTAQASGAREPNAAGPAGTSPSESSPGSSLSQIPNSVPTAVTPLPSFAPRSSAAVQGELVPSSSITGQPVPVLPGQEVLTPQRPLGPGEVEIPIGRPALAGQVQSQGGLVTISVHEASLHSVLSLLAQQQGLSIVAPSNLEMPISVTLQPTPLDNALDALLAVSGCTWTRNQNVIYVTPITKDGGENFLVQGREVRVFELNYAAAADVEKIIVGLLSPIGKVFTRQIDSKDKRKAVEQVVIEDLPHYVHRIANYVAQADQPPRQVLVEVRLLQVKLGDNLRHGVNLESLAKIAGATVTFKAQAFTTGVGPAGIFTVDGNDFDSLLDCLRSTNDAKTLATPKLLMLNGQESKIQIGRRLGYFITTATQVSTLQSVQFLEVGIVLTVSPQITADGQIVMKVHPKVSSGQVNSTTSLPEEETTEVDTSIMVPDGQGIILGGLIQETDVEQQNKIPFLGDVWLVGRIFQRRTVQRERSEVVVALLPRIIPMGAQPGMPECRELQRVDVPLLTPELQSMPRGDSRPSISRSPAKADNACCAAAGDPVGEATANRSPTFGPFAT